MDPGTPSYPGFGERLPGGQSFGPMRLPAPATTISVVALVAALSGSAYAAAKIGSGDVRNNSLRSVDVRDRSLRGPPPTSSPRARRSGSASSASWTTRRRSSARTAASRSRASPVPVQVFDASYDATAVAPDGSVVHGLEVFAGVNVLDAECVVGGTLRVG